MELTAPISHVDTRGYVSLKKIKKFSVIQTHGKTRSVPPHYNLYYTIETWRETMLFISIFNTN